MAIIRLIMSGAPVGQELAAEFGPLPPAMLPVGTHRLYELQVAALPGSEPTWLVLPETYAVSAFDRERLDQAGVEVLHIPCGLELGEAIIYAVNSIGMADGPLHILHGDTVATPPQDVEDVILAASKPNDYSWAELDVPEAGPIRSLATLEAGARGHGGPIAIGYFALSSSQQFLQALTRMRGNFIDALNHYISQRPVLALPAANWLDFGHLQTFFQSRLAVSTERGFNNLEIDGITARKSSLDRAKIWAEASWYQAVPVDVQVYTARLLEVGANGDVSYYDTVYEYLPVLSELFVFGSLGEPVWARVLGQCEDFLRRCSYHKSAKPADLALRRLSGEKTQVRLEAFARASGFDLNKTLSLAGRACPSLASMAEQLAAASQAPTGRSASVIHGDFCFSNILFDSRTRRIRVVDPRGLVGDDVSLYGDLRYDLAKLGHSILGRYDHIIAGRYRLQVAATNYDLEFEDTPAQAWLRRGLAGITIDGVNALDPSVLAVMTGLFLSMLPLHSDRPDRQQAFIANGLRLYRELDR